MNITKKSFQILASLWIMYIFLGSLPYKFTRHEHTQYIFGTIGEWLGTIFGTTVGNNFSNYAAYIIGGGELIVSIILFAAIVFTVIKKNSAHLFGIGGLGAMALMSGAVFFHLATPLGIEVNNDGGSLFGAAVSILFLGASMFIINFSQIKEKLIK